MLGRPSNNLQVGVVGMPNVGKSSLFNILSRCGASICNACMADSLLNQTRSMQILERSPTSPSSSRTFVIVKKTPAG